MSLNKFSLCILVSALIFGTTGYAAVTNPAAMQSLSSAQSWLDKIGPVQGDFIQTDSEGKISTGKFYLARPGRLRFDYIKPPLKVIANEGKLVYEDPTIEQITTLELSKTPLSTLLDASAHWQEKTAIKSFSRNDTEDRLTIAQKQNPEGGELTLVFNRNPIALKQWTITDFEGKETKVVLSNLNPLTHISKSLFKLPKGS